MKLESNNFQQRKKDVLSKADKSHIGQWDEPILKLCNKINKLQNFYTTSSCSGRIVIMFDNEKKGKDLFVKVYHDLLKLKDFLNDLTHLSLVKRGDNKEINNKKILNSLIKFKQEPPILHVACKDLEDADSLLKKAQLAGWKKSGLISIKGNIILELNSTERIEFLLINKGRMLVNDEFLELIIKRCNDNLKKGWEKIEKLENMI